MRHTHTHTQGARGRDTERERKRKLTLSLDLSSKKQKNSNFYPPTSASFSLPPSNLPPLLVKIHGGPTGQAPAAFSLGVAFWTSRGFAVADVNYRGSSGYGRAFRKALAGEWGIADVEDVASAARYLAEEGLVDSGKLTVTGGSAGG